MTPRPLVGLLFLALAAVLAFGASVPPRLNALRWTVALAMVAWGIFSLRQKRGRIEQVYVQVLAMGLAIGAVGVLIPASDSRGLIVLGGLLALLSSGLLIASWHQRRHPSPDDPNRPR